MPTSMHMSLYKAGELSGLSLGAVDVMLRHTHMHSGGQVRLDSYALSLSLPSLMEVPEDLVFR